MITAFNDIGECIARNAQVTGAARVHCNCGNVMGGGGTRSYSRSRRGHLASNDRQTRRHPTDVCRVSFVVFRRRGLCRFADVQCIVA